MAWKIPYVAIPYGESGAPGTWQRLQTPAGRSASLVCPECRQKGVLTGHQISAAGEVTPSVICECGYHEWVRLEGWNGPHA